MQIYNFELYIKTDFFFSYRQIERKFDYRTMKRISNTFRILWQLGNSGLENKFERGMCITRIGCYNGVKYMKRKQNNFGKFQWKWRLESRIN